MKAAEERGAGFDQLNNNRRHNNCNNINMKLGYKILKTSLKAYQMTKQFGCLARPKMVDLVLGLFIVRIYLPSANLNLLSRLLARL